VAVNQQSFGAGSAGVDQGGASSSGGLAAAQAVLSPELELDSSVEVSLDNFDPVVAKEESLLEIENRVCSHGDTVHYAEKPKIFDHCSGSYLYDGHQTPYLDL
jgi:hypothetical protein